jgi:hypothetical protein
MIHTCKDCGLVYDKGCACPLCESANVETTKWVNKIKIKDLFVNEPTDKDVLNCCNRIIPQLETILKNNEEFLGEYSDIYNQLDEITCAFKDMKSYLDKGKKFIPCDTDEETWADEFNHWLDELYSLGDLVIDETVSFHNQQHFIWVG